MSEQIQALAEQLVDIDIAIQEAKDAMADALGGVYYAEALGVKEELLRERHEIVEKLEEIGLEDPDL